MAFEIRLWHRRMDSNWSGRLKLRLEANPPVPDGRMVGFFRSLPIEIRRAGSEDCESLDTGAVEFSPADFARVADLLRPLSADP